MSHDSGAYYNCELRSFQQIPPKNLAKEKCHKQKHQKFPKNEPETYRIMLKY